MNVLEKTGSDWLVCTVAETCNGLEMKGIVPMNSLRLATRPGENYS